MNKSFLQSIIKGGGIGQTANVQYPMPKILNIQNKTIKLLSPKYFRNHLPQPSSFLNRKTNDNNRNDK